MTKEQFEQEVLALTQTLYRVSSSLLPRAQDQHDAVQSALLRAWQSLPRLRREESFRPWLLRIVVNECRQIVRNSRRLVYVETVEQGAAPEDSGLREAIRSLPETLRLPLVLHYLEGFSVREVAEISGAPPGTVKTRLRKARGLLREWLEEEV